MKKRIVFLIIVISLFLVGFGESLQAASGSAVRLLSPLQVTGQPANTWTVMDQDIETQPDLESGLEYIYFTFSQGIVPDFINVYLAQECINRFGLEYNTDAGVWVSVPGFNSIYGGELVTGWNRLNLGITWVVSRFRLRVEKAGTIQRMGISEIEFWGQASAGFPAAMQEYNMEEDVTLEFKGGSNPKGATLPQSVHVDISGPVHSIKKAELVYDVYDLESHVEGFWEINGGGYHALTPPGEKHLWTTAIEEVNPDLLIQGVNTIRFKIGDTKKNGFKIANVRVRLYYDLGLREIATVQGCGINEQLLPNLIDGDESTYWESTWQVHDQVSFTLQLAERTNIEYVGWLQSGPFVDSVRVEYRTQAGWQLFAPEVVDQEGGWHYRKAAQNVETEQLRLTWINPEGKQMIGPLHEIQIWGSRVSSRQQKPEITVSYPREGDVVDHSTLIKGFVRGNYDQVKVNGEVVAVRDQYFELETGLPKQTQSENFRRTIEVEVLQDGKVVNRERVNVFLKPLPIVSIESPENGCVTDADSVLVRGTTNLTSNRIWINDQYISTGSLTYQISHPLEEGVNPVTVRAVSNQGLSSEITIYVRKDTLPPVIHFMEEYDGLMLDDSLETYTVEGYIEDYSSGRLYFNGIEAPVVDGYFSYPLPLVHGYNQFSVKAVDLLGHESSMAFGVIQDSTPPEAFTPVADPAFWSTNRQPVLHFATADLQTGVDHYELSLDGGEFVLAVSPFTLPVLTDGVHTVQVKAVDRVGHERVESVQVYVDTICAEPFQPVTQIEGWTNDNTPVIFFNAVDAHSGVEYYEVKVDEGESIRAESPYTLPQVTDGIHDVYVKAVDWAGNCIVGQVKIYIDTEKPVEFTPIAEPAEWSTNTRPVVSFATTDALSGLSHYELKVDQGAYRVIQSPFKLPVLSDGEHSVTIQAVDLAGMSREASVQVYVDTTAPEVFTPVAEPAGWTKNSRPVITFDTVDVASGLDHYELQIDQGDFSRVSSPYQLPDLTDGIHEITVKAFDQLGHVTVGVTKVYVDTTSPVIPANFEVNPGDGEVVIRWSSNSEADLREYRLHRTPAWSTGGSKQILLDQGTTYVDLEVTNGEEYQYYMVAVDHVENLSSATATIRVKAGVSMVEVNPAEGGEVEYGREVVVNIPAEALTEEGTIRVTTVEEAQIPAASKPVLSKTYQFDVVDEDGEVKEGKFAKEITIAVGYDETLIPENYTDFDLDVYYFSETDGYWVKMPKEGIDLA